MNRDGRQLSREALSDIRTQAVLRVEAGLHPEDVVKLLGFHRSCIYRWMATYREQGLEGLKKKTASGRPPKLTDRQLGKLYKLISTQNPLQLNFEFALWTCALVRQVIRDGFSVSLSEVSVGRLLKKLGLSPQKPLYRAYEQDQERVMQWKEQGYPAIVKQAKKEGALIFFGDEASVRSDHHSGKTWAPIGQTPTIEATGARFSLPMISAISPAGGFRFMTFEERMNAAVFVSFLGRLVSRQKRPIFLIVDGHSVHRSRQVSEYVQSLGKRLQLFILPPYSPQLNPDEWVWNWLKTHKLGRVIVKDRQQLRSTVQKYLRKLSQLKATLRGFFQDPQLSYIHECVA